VILFHVCAPEAIAIDDGVVDARFAEEGIEHVLRFIEEPSRGIKDPPGDVIA
jgi:hypothetical protein